MKEELIIKGDECCRGQDDYDALREAVSKLSAASQEQFESIKKEKWYNRVFDMVTFSQKNKKRVAEQVGTLAQAQQILVELLLRLSNNDANISEIVTESMDDIRRIQEQNIYLLSQINRLENIALGIKPDMNINSLSELGKQALSALLYYVNEKTGVASEAQKKYANVVLDYIDVDVRMDNPILALDKLDINAKRQILACCLEYLFLRDCSEHAYDEYKDFISEFDLGNKSIKKIEEQIFSIYKLRGVEGFYTKYQKDNFEELSDGFFADIEVESEEETESQIEMTDEIISSILHIRAGEVKQFCYKNIHLNAYINCEGELDFDHCAIYYNESSAGDEITLAKNAKLSIKNSWVECKGVDETAFITCKGENSVIFENTTFKNCSYFIKADWNGVCYFSLTKCRMHNCFDEFVDIHMSDAASCDISNNTIVQDNLCSFYSQKGKFRYPKLISISSYSDNLPCFKENVIRLEDTFKSMCLDLGESQKLQCFDCNNANVKNCTFIGLPCAIKAASITDCRFEKCDGAIDLDSFRGKKIVDNCVFVECTNVIGTKVDTQIRNCQFVSCYDSIIFPRDYEGGVTVEFCEFINTRNTIKRDEKYVRRAVWGKLSCITFRRSKDTETKQNYLRKCIFDGVEIEEFFLIQAAGGPGKPYGTVASIQDCDFRNCATKRETGKIIKEYLQYYGLFNKTKDFQANIIENCRGLDKINKERTKSSVVKIKTISTTGSPIGAILAQH